jgi:hypothetical protein
MTKPRFFTKSRFKVAYECPAKIFFNDQPKRYGNKKSDNTFLRALAQGGFQVGALAKLDYPDGIDLEPIKDNLEAIARTTQLLKRGQGLGSPRVCSDDSAAPFAPGNVSGSKDLGEGW